MLRRNPIRAKEIKQSREDKYKRLLAFIEKQNDYLREHPRAKIATAKQKMASKSKQLKIDEWVQVSCHERSLSLSKDAGKLQELEKLDGCYALKTDLSSDKAPKEVIHDRYKDLALVEQAFRTSKTTQLEMYPVNVRLESRTRAHAFVVMMACRIVKELASLWASLNLTVQEALAELDALCTTKVSIAKGGCFHRIPEPRELSRQLLELAGVKLSPVLASKGIRVATKKKLSSQRKVA